MSTYSPKPGDITRSWHLIDADDVVLGRLAVTAATLLRGSTSRHMRPMSTAATLLLW
jgi:large subunit ribosomal protein L13